MRGVDFQSSERASQLDAYADKLSVRLTTAVNALSKQKWRPSSCSDLTAIGYDGFYQLVAAPTPHPRSVDRLLRGLPPGRNAERDLDAVPVRWAGGAWGDVGKEQSFFIFMR
jgi:hypothetical protein